MSHNKKSFGKWLVAIFAAVMRTIAPTLCVKFFTKRYKYSRYYGSYHNASAMAFLPHTEKQLKAIKRLKLSDEQLQERVWSRKAQIALLKDGRYALLERVDSKDTEMLDLLCQYGGAEQIAKVFVRSTPSVTYLRRFLLAHTEKAIAVAGIAPSVFNDLGYDDLPATAVTEILSIFLSLDLEDKKSKSIARHWAEEVMKRPAYYASALDGEDAVVFDKAMHVLTNTEYDFSEILDSLKVYHPKWYAEVRDKAWLSPNLAKYLGKVLPEIGKRLGDLCHYSLDVPIEGDGLEASVEEDALRWLNAAALNLQEPDVQIELMKLPEMAEKEPSLLWHELQEKVVCAVTEFGAIKMAINKLPAKYRPMLEPVLAHAIKSPYQAEIALEMLGTEYHDGILKKMVETATNYDAETILRKYPFNGWLEDTAKTAVKKLAEAGILPLDRMQELTKPLQDYAWERLEVQAELAFLAQYKIPEEVMRRKLHPEAEVVLFSHSYSHFANQPAKLYVLTNVLSDAGFKQLATVQRIENCSVGDIAKDLLRLYANNHGLSEQNYIDLMAGPYKALAPELKCYLRSEMTEVAPAPEANAEEDIDDDTVRVVGA